MHPITRKGSALIVLVATLCLGTQACSSDAQGDPSPYVPGSDAAEAAAPDGGQEESSISDVDPEQEDLRPLLDLIVRGEGGKVVSNPPGIDCTTSCQAHFDPGTQVVLTAKPESGYWFGGWHLDGTYATDAQKYTVTMAKSHQVKASFFLDKPPWDSTVGAADCQAAWDQGLSACDKTPDDFVVVNKAKRNLALCKQGASTQNFRIGLGFGPTGDKEQQGDGKTPEGVFYISALVPDSSYYKAFLLSYPDKEDAERGLASGLITAADKTSIDSAIDSCGEPPSSTGLGGEIEIHGGTGSTDWTAGCVAVEDNQIDILWGVLEKGDTVVVLP
ncbi:MAG: L,D-transpeptidase family protein [Deltaproteobacteria bacterium]|nr:L,D-transpeptidase family protein [Deltaproteobacteria bacterium]